MGKKLVIEITDSDGRTQLLKRNNGIAKFLDNIDSMFKRGSIVRAIKGVTMFIADESGGTIPVFPDAESVGKTGGSIIPEGPDLSEVPPYDPDEETAKARMSDEGGPEPEDK